MRESLHDVVSVKEGFFDETADVTVLSLVIDAVAVLSGPHEPGEAQLRQVLRNSGGVGSDVPGEMVDRVFCVQQRPQNA